MTSEPLANRPNRGYVPWYRRWIFNWRFLTACVVLTLLTPVGIRWYRLSWLPDIPAPFDMEEFSQVPGPTQENAFFYYSQAVALGPSVKLEQNLYDRWDQGIAWDDLSDSTQAAVVAQQPALALFQQGARCDEACYLPPSQYNFSVMLPLIQSMRELFRITYLESLRQLDEGNTAEAAELLHDGLRASRHLGRRGCIIERLVGIACQATLKPGWQQWSRHPDVTADDIEAALTRMRDDWKLTIPPSDGFKTEYISLINETKGPSALFYMELDTAVDNFLQQNVGVQITSQLNQAIPGWKLPLLWTLAEPELTARAARHFLKHELNFCDLPYSEQPPIIQESLHLHDAPDPVSRMSAPELNRRLRGTAFSMVCSAYQQFLAACRGDEARQRLLETELELQLRFRRTSAKSRAEVESWLGEFAWPVDPCSKTGEVLRHRLTDEGIVLWSLGFNSIDDGGGLDDTKRYQDIVSVIPWPGAAKDESGRELEE